MNDIETIFCVRAAINYGIKYASFWYISFVFWSDELERVMNNVIAKKNRDIRDEKRKRYRVARSRGCERGGNGVKQVTEHARGRRRHRAWQGRSLCTCLHLTGGVVKGGWGGVRQAGSGPGAYCIQAVKR
ncbi:hypothetical protein B0H14DRAFT_2573130 [Mycena olivaceomarginata]|nr:hypothetical protein B0H14DRAFT_2573130 [Mycena olivaceomarginata]